MRWLRLFVFLRIGQQKSEDGAVGVFLFTASILILALRFIRVLGILFLDFNSEPNPNTVLGANAYILNERDRCFLHWQEGCARQCCSFPSSLCILLLQLLREPGLRMEFQRSFDVVGEPETEL